MAHDQIQHVFALTLDNRSFDHVLGSSGEACGSADLVAFTDESGEWHALQVIFEFKAPDIDNGKAQLLRYLSNEPMAKMVIGQIGREASSLQATSGGLGLC